MPIVKTYRYSIQIDKVHQFLDIQKRADFLYKENLRYSQALYKMRGGSGQWLEIQTFPDFDTMQKADTLVDHVPELKELFQLNCEKLR